MKPVAQRDLTRPCPRCQALRDNRRLLRIAPASPPRRSRQNLHPTKTVPINWQITWHTIPPASINRGSRITPSPSPAARWGSGSAYNSPNKKWIVNRACFPLQILQVITEEFFEGRRDGLMSIGVGAATVLPANVNHS